MGERSNRGRAGRGVGAVHGSQTVKGPQGVHRPDVQSNRIDGQIVDKLNKVGHDIQPATLHKQALRVQTPEHIFVRKRRDVLLVGPPGVGKSHVAQSIGLAMIKSGYTVFYRSIFDCVRDLLHDEAFEGHERVMAKYLKPDLLIIDDMGMKNLPKRSGEFLFEIIMRRHELRSTIMTSNRPLEDWGKLIGDVPAATAILDRFLQDAELLEITGRSYRLRGKTGTKSKPAKPDHRGATEKSTNETKK